MLVKPSSMLSLISVTPTLTFTVSLSVHGTNLYWLTNRGTCVKDLPRVTAQQWNAGDRISNLHIASWTHYLLCHHIAPCNSPGNDKTIWLSTGTDLTKVYRNNQSPVGQQHGILPRLLSRDWLEDRAEHVYHPHLHHCTQQNLTVTTVSNQTEAVHGHTRSRI